MEKRIQKKLAALIKERDEFIVAANERVAIMGQWIASLEELLQEPQAGEQEPGE